VSEIDKTLAGIEAKRARDEAARRKRRDAACAFLKAFYEKDVKRSQKLRDHGVEIAFEDGRLVLQKPAEGQFSEGLMIVVGQQGEIDVGGKSFGRFASKDEAKTKKELIGEIILHLSL
jgi:hypothetical protein